ncbi:MAG: FAD-dependent monooxygenase [Afipia sp.]
MTASPAIVVAGAGIGGLTASLTLAGHGFRVLVLERAERLEEAGAGLQLSPNANRVLIGLGLESQLSSHAIAPDAVRVMTARTGREVARIPLREAAVRYGAPYWVLHRADLQAALAAKVAQTRGIELRLGAEVTDITPHSHGVTVSVRQGETDDQIAADMLIGADGVWSTVRQRLFPDVHPQFTGRIAWRGIIEADRAPREFDLHAVQLWLGANAHLVAYPMADGRRINVVAITTDTWHGPGWSEPGDAADLAARFSARRWPDAGRRLIAAVENWRKWALFAIRDGGVWQTGHVALLGDAAHAMAPFVAQGAGMAIEDAAVLAKRLANAPADIPAALKRYERLRTPRVTRVQRTAHQTGGIYHLSGPMALARDTTMALLGGERLLARQNWIYGWRAE